MNVITRHWELKLLALGFSVALWLFVMTSERSELILAAPIEFEGLPAGLTMTSDRPDSVDIQVHALRGSLSRLTPDQIKVRISLSGATSGEMALRILPEHVIVPYGITVVRVNPSRLRVMLEASTAPRAEVVPRGR